MSQLFNDEWHYFGSWPGISFGDIQIWQGPFATQYFQQEIGLWRGSLNVIEHGHRGSNATLHCFVRKVFFDNAKQFLDNTLETEPDKIASRLRQYYSFNEPFRKDMQAIAEVDVKSLDNNALADLYLRGKQLQSQMSIYDQFGIFCEDYFKDRADQILEKLIPDKTERFKVFTELTAPCSLSTLQLEEIALLEALQNALDDSSFANAVQQNKPRDVRAALISTSIDQVQQIAQRFGWLPVFLAGPSWGEDHYLRQLCDISLEHGDALKDFVANRIHELNALPGAQKELAVARVEELELSEAESKIFETFRLIMDARNECEYHVGAGTLGLRNVVNETLSRLGLDEIAIHNLFIEEIAQLLRGELTIADIPLEDRKQISGFWYEDEQHLQVMSSSEAQQFIDKQLAKYKTDDNDTQSDYSEATGVCASLGTAQGPASIIFSTEDFGKFKTGDILIAEATTADYVPLMKKASGIIAEHGGITCHAAIVARELGIPAIVGFPGATTKFKDGQQLAFDAIEATVQVVES